MNGGEHTHAQIVDLYVKQRRCCAVCRERFELKKMHRDHIIPLVLGGSSDIHNIQLLCAPCNLKKNKKHPVQFMQQLGYLL